MGVTWKLILFLNSTEKSGWKMSFFFRYFAKLNGQFLENGWSDFRFLYFFKCTELNFESPISGKIFDISHSFIEKTRKTYFQTWQPWNWQYCETLTWWKKTDSGFGLNNSKLYGNKWFCFKTKKVNFVDLCNCTKNYITLIYALN